MDKNILYRYFNGKVTLDELHNIRNWQEESEANKDLLRRERKLFNAMILTGSLEDNKPIAEEIGKRSGHKWSRLGKIAASIAIAVGIAATLLFTTHSTSNPLAFHTIHVPYGQRVEILLSDSTHVWLNANTTMTYPSEFTKDKREVTINGEAFFEVKHNNRWPFLVHTSQMDIKDLGTKFNVEAYTDKGYVETSLIEGKVEIVSADKKAHFLQPGQKLRAMSGNIKLSTIDDPDSYRWREGLYCFNNKTLSNIMKDFEKYYGLRIEIRNKKIRHIVLSGKFRIAEGLDYALSILQTKTPFHYYRNEATSTLYIE